MPQYDLLIDDSLKDKQMVFSRDSLSLDSLFQIVTVKLHIFELISEFFQLNLVSLLKLNNFNQLESLTDLV